jgi:hypothetical protein
VEYVLVLSFGILIGYFAGAKASTPKPERRNGITFSEKLSKRHKL